MATRPEPWPWPDSLDGPDAAPGIHRVPFENDRDRVVETVTRSGETTPVHTHRQSTVSYVISGSALLRRDEHGTGRGTMRDDLTFDRRLLISASGAAALLMALPGLVLGDAVATPSDPNTPIVETDFYLPIKVALLGVAIILVVIRVLRPTWRRRIGAAVIGLAFGGLGLLLMVAGLFFADWTGNHRVSVPVVLVGAVIVIGSLLVARRVGRRPAVEAPPAGPPESH